MSLARHPCCRCHHSCRTHIYSSSASYSSHSSFPSWPISPTPSWPPPHPASDQHRMSDVFLLSTLSIIPGGTSRQQYASLSASSHSSDLTENFLLHWMQNRPTMNGTSLCLFGTLPCDNPGWQVPPDAAIRHFRQNAHVARLRNINVSILKGMLLSFVVVVVAWRLTILPPPPNGNC